MPVVRVRRRVVGAVAAVVAALVCTARAGADGVVPHGQNQPPGPALSPEQAVARMTLPAGFKVECVASEPDVVNPTAFTFDDRGRIWVTESIEYPRASAGKGHDRIKVLESTRHDGRYDKVTVFKDGLNIPCGVAIGNGGVYVTNSPDVLFLQDTHGTGHCDKVQVILTGFGRDDRHELPNSLTWGPDGWLYGMNGVFNRSRITSPADGKVYDFTCAIWRYQPRSRKFELFCEGTSNPWGLDYNRGGDWFVSCCVIDHLFHMTQSGYYLRQGGPYPPMTHWLPSITTERHQQAAYAGLCLYDADAYPQEYRGRLFMGNLHGSCINQDTLARNGATYTQHNAPDFLSAHDAWFMPVSQKIGPDGCLYVLDWYDRYHCYQDANRDSPGLDRSRGRIYRISYRGTPAPGAFDLDTASTDELLHRLDDPNVWWRRTAQRVLDERFDPSMVPTLEKMALDASDHNNGHMHALWLLVSRHAMDESFHLNVLSSPDEPTRNWGVRGAGEMRTISPAVYEKLKQLAGDPSPDVRAQVAVAAGRIQQPDPLPLLEAMLQNAANASDPIIPTLIYNNLKPMVKARGNEILAFLDANPAVEKSFGNTTAAWLRRLIDAQGRTPREIVDDLSRTLSSRPTDDKAREAVQEVADALAQAPLKPGDRAALFDSATRAAVLDIAAHNYRARVPATLIALWWNDPQAIKSARTMLSDPWTDSGVRSQLLRVLAETGDPNNVPAFAAIVRNADVPVLIRQAAVDALGSMNDPGAARILVTEYPNMPADLKPMAINALTHSVAGGLALMTAVDARTISPADVNANHARQLLGLNSPELARRVRASWGEVKTDRDPERVKVVERMRKLVTSRPPGDPAAGQLVFNRVCAQCHTIYGHGGNVGPDLTGVGRENLDAILTNVLDPSLVIGAPYLVHVVRTRRGEVYSGILVEKTDEHIVLKDPTKTTTIPAADVEKTAVQNISMMPEGLEKSMTDPEFCDLVAFLLTREPPAPRTK